MKLRRLSRREVPVDVDRFATNSFAILGPSGMGGKFTLLLGR